MIRRAVLSILLLSSLRSLCLCGDPTDPARLTTDGDFKEHLELVARRQAHPHDAHPRGPHGPVGHERRRLRPQAAAQPRPEDAALRRLLVAGRQADRLRPRHPARHRRRPANRHGQRRRRRRKDGRAAQGLRGVAALVAGRQAHRLGQHPRRQPGHLHHGPRGQGRPATHQRPGAGRQPELVAGRQEDRLLQRPHRATCRSTSWTPTAPTSAA